MARPELEREMLRDFKLRASAFPEARPSTDLEWLFVMQHYGMPTRLLDWTESSLAALFFAVTQYHNEDDACVWVFHPWSLNELVLDAIAVPTSTHPDLRKWLLVEDGQAFRRKVESRAPVAVRPARSTARIVAQRGMFTIHGDDPRALDVQFSPGSGEGQIQLQRIDIDGRAKREIARRLLIAGVSDSVLFPELPGLSREISFRYSKDYG